MDRSEPPPPAAPEGPPVPGAPGSPDPPATPSPAPRKPLLRRWWVWALLVLAAGATVAFLYRNALLRRGIETAVTKTTGFPLALDTFEAEILRARVSLGGLRLSNPPDFEDPRCLDVPRLTVDMDLESLFGRDIHVQEIDLHVREVVVVKNAAGETSLDRLQALGGKGGKEGKEPTPEEKPAARREGKDEPPPKWRCDRLRLRIGKVLYRDFSQQRKDGSPKEEVYDLDVDEEFRDLTEPDQVVRILVLKILKGTPLRLVNASVDSLLSGLGGVSDRAGKFLSGAAGAVGDAVKGIGEGIGGLFGGKEEEPPKDPPKKPRKK